jgi:hypothetical protein
MRTLSNVVTIRLNLSGLSDGVCTGLCHFVSSQSASLGVAQKGLVRSLRYKKKDTSIDGPALAGDDLWLRSTWGADGKSQFSYSVDGNAFVPFGDPYQLTWAGYRGDRTGIFCYNNKSEAGFVDVKFFHYAYAGPK